MLINSLNVIKNPTMHAIIQSTVMLMVGTKGPYKPQATQDWSQDCQSCNQYWRQEGFLYTSILITYLNDLDYCEICGYHGGNYEEYYNVM